LIYTQRFITSNRG